MLSSSGRKRRAAPVARQRLIRHQRGSFTLDAMLALGISAVVAVNAQMASTRARDMNTMVATGQYMQGLQVAVNRYISANNDALATGAGVAGVANQYAPTLQELLNGNYMPAGWTLNNPANLAFTVSMTPSNCPGPTCQFPATITSSAYRDSFGNVRNDLLSYAVMSAGLDAGQSLSGNPGQFTSIRKTWAMPNGSGSAGTLMMRAGSYTNGYVDTAPFYKLDGSRKLTGAMQANGQNIVGAGNLTANSLGLPAGNSLTISGVQWYGDGSNSAIRMNGNLYIQGPNGAGARSLNAQDGNFAGNASVAGTASITQTNTSNANVWGTLSANQTNTSNANVGGTLSANQLNASNANIWGSQTTYGNHWVNGALVAGNVVYLPALAWEGWGCGGNAITTDPNGKLLSCQGGVWRSPLGGAQVVADVWQDCNTLYKRFTDGSVQAFASFAFTCGSGGG